MSIGNSSSCSAIWTHKWSPSRSLKKERMRKANQRSSQSLAGQLTNGSGTSSKIRRGKMAFRCTTGWRPRKRTTLTHLHASARSLAWSSTTTRNTNRRFNQWKATGTSWKQMYCLISVSASICASLWLPIDLLMSCKSALIRSTVSVPQRSQMRARVVEGAKSKLKARRLWKTAQSTN